MMARTRKEQTMNCVFPQFSPKVLAQNGPQDNETQVQHLLAVEIRKLQRKPCKESFTLCCLQRFSASVLQLWELWRGATTRFPKSHQRNAKSSDMNLIQTCSKHFATSFHDSILASNTQTQRHQLQHWLSRQSHQCNQKICNKKLCHVCWKRTAIPEQHGSNPQLLHC